MSKFYWSFNEDADCWDNSADTIEKCILVAQDEVREYEECEDYEVGEIKTKQAIINMIEAIEKAGQIKGR